MFRHGFRTLEKLCIFCDLGFFFCHKKFGLWRTQFIMKPG